MNKVQSQSTSTEGRPGRKKMQWGQQERDSRRNCICSKFEPCPEDARSPHRHANSRLPSSLPEWRNLYVEYGGGLANPGEKILQEKNSKQSPWLSDGQDPELGWYHGTVLLLRVSSRRQRGHKKSSLCLAGRHTSSISHPSALVLLPAACDYVIASQCFPPKLLLLPGPQEAPPRNFLAPSAQKLLSSDMVHFTNTGKSTPISTELPFLLTCPDLLVGKGALEPSSTPFAFLLFLYLEGRDFILFFSIGRRFEVRRGDKSHVNEKSTGWRVQVSGPPLFSCVALDQTLLPKFPLFPLLQRRRPDIHLLLDIHLGQGTCQLEVSASSSETIDMKTVSVSWSGCEDQKR